MPSKNQIIPTQGHHAKCPSGLRWKTGTDTIPTQGRHAKRPSLQGG